ncbi:MAG: hemolysin III family protein [Myxococcota bacterium]|nr:hemolysin III family protein [Myxococcota bacterium]
MRHSNEPISTLESHGRSQEIANAVTHGIGAGLAIAALAVLVTFAGLQGDPWKVVSFSIYGSMLVLLYMASTLYHALVPRKAKKVFQILDHSAIYLVIAGTYTPFMLVTLRGPWGWTLFGITWGLAALGVTLTALFIDKLKLGAVLTYVGMGWMIVIAFKPLIAELSMGGLWWLLAGGFSYTIGILFYANKRIPFHHTIWHMFVLGGSTAHFFAMLFYVLPAGTSN